MFGIVFNIGLGVLARLMPQMQVYFVGVPLSILAGFLIFSPGEIMPSGDVAALATQAFAGAFKIGLQLSAPFLVFGLVFNIGLGVLARLMPQMQVYFVGVPLSIFAGFLILALVLTAMMSTYLDYFVQVMHEMMPLK